MLLAAALTGARRAKREVRHPKRGRFNAQRVGFTATGWPLWNVTDGSDFVGRFKATHAWEAIATAREVTL